MEDIEVRGKISVDAGNSTKSIGDLKKEIKEANAEMESAVIGSKEYQAAQQKLSKATNELNSSTTQTTGKFGKLRQSVGDLVPGLDGAASGAASFGKQLWALVANPIGAILLVIVGTLTALYKAFTSTNDGADKMEQIMDGLGAVLNVVRDRVLKFGEALFKFFTGDLLGAIKSGKEAVSGFGAEVEREFKQAADATAQLQEVEDAMRSLGVSRAKLNRDLAKSKELLTDETASYRDKKKAIDEVREAETKQTASELAAARKLLAAIKQKNSLSDVSDEALQKQADAEAKVYELEEQSARNIRSLNKQERSIEQAERAKAEAARKAHAEKVRQAKEKEAQRLKTQRENQLAYEAQDRKLDQELELAQIEDETAKKIRLLELERQEENRINLQSLKEKKLTKAQFADIEASQVALNKIKIAKVEEEARKEDEKQEADLLNKKKANEQSYFGLRKMLLDQEKLNVYDRAQAMMKIAKEEADFQISEINRKRDAEVAAAEKLGLDTSAIKEGALIKTQEINAAIALSEQQLAEAKIAATYQAGDAVASTLENTSNLLGKTTAAGKALSAASALISTFTSAQKAYESTIGIPFVGPVLAPINAGLAAAAGLANVKKILSVQVPGGGGGSAPSAPSYPAPVRPQQASTSLDNKSIQAVGNAAQGGVNRAFVVATDVKNSQEREARIQRAARLD